MTCNAYEYNKLVNKLYYGVALTDSHLNNAAEQLRNYIIEGGAKQIVDNLGIGIGTHEQNGKIKRKRLIYIDGANKGKELTINEIINIGLFLKGGARCLSVCNY